MPPTILALLLLAVVSPVDLEKSCNAGNAGDCLQLGIRIHDGFGVRRDPALAARASHAGDAERAEQLAEEADDLGDPVGYAHLGDLYARTNDTVRAIVYFKHACDAGMAHGCAGHGFLLLESGIDEKKGRELL